MKGQGAGEEEEEEEARALLQRGLQRVACRLCRVFPFHQLHILKTGFQHLCYTCNFVYGESRPYKI
jgi:hypothetical protein